MKNEEEKIVTIELIWLVRGAMCFGVASLAMWLHGYRVRIEGSIFLLTAIELLIFCVACAFSTVLTCYLKERQK